MYLKYMQNKQLLKNIDLHIKILQRQKKYLIETASKFSLEIINCINQKGKILIAGNGGSASDAQHFSTELTVKMSKIRKALPFISLSTDTSAITAIGNDFNFDKIFSRQIEAIGFTNDIFIPISTSGNSKNIINAVKIAKRKKIKILSILGNKGGKVKNFSDQSFIVDSNNPSRIQEIHIIFYQNLCQIVENYFFSIDGKN